jgi:hypothetical protein
VIKLSISLNEDDIKNIDSYETQQKIIKSITSYVKELSSTYHAIEIEVNPISLTNGIHGNELLQFAKLIDKNALTAAETTIKKDCGKIDSNEW